MKESCFINNYFYKERGIMNAKLIERMKAVMAEKQISQAELAKMTGIRASSISDYLNNRYEPKQDKIYLIADALRVNPAWLSGRDSEVAKAPATTPKAQNITATEKRMVPVLGSIAAGQPIYADEHIETYVPCDARCHVDFGVMVRGDSMIDVGIEEGDIVFIQRLPDVDDGQIAAVRIDDTATLKRVYHIPGGVRLVSENPNYSPMIFTAENCDAIQILGLAVAKFSWIER